MLKKICGITSLEEAEMVSSYFPDYLGFIFHAPSRRNISVETLAEISDTLRVCFGDGCPQLVSVLVNPEKKFLEQVAPFVDVFQLHGEESPEFCAEVAEQFPDHSIWKALRVQNTDDLPKIFEYVEQGKCNGILLDSFSQKAQGGTGERISGSFFPKIRAVFDQLKEKSPEVLTFMAGGISRENYKDIQEQTLCMGVDLSSSLESAKGNKSEKKVEAFFCEK